MLSKAFEKEQELRCLKVTLPYRLKCSLVHEVMLLLTQCSGVHNPAPFLVSFLVKEGTLQSDFGNCVAVQFTSAEVGHRQFGKEICCTETGEVSFPISWYVCSHARSMDCR